MLHYHSLSASVRHFSRLSTFGLSKRSGIIFHRATWSAPTSWILRALPFPVNTPHVVYHRSFFHVFIISIFLLLVIRCGFKNSAKLSEIIISCRSIDENDNYIFPRIESFLSSGCGWHLLFQISSEINLHNSIKLGSVEIIDFSFDFLAPVEISSSIARVSVNISM